MSELKQSQRIVVVRNEFEPCLKLAAQSSRHCKLACAYLLELQNRLKLVDMKTPSLSIKMSAVDSSLSRNANYLGINLANRTGRMAQKRKANNTLVSKKREERVEHAVMCSRRNQVFTWGIAAVAQSVPMQHKK